MGLDSYILGAFSVSVQFGRFGIRGDGVLAFSVCASVIVNVRAVLTNPSIKVLSLIVFFILAICISAGAIGPRKIGFAYWHDPGAFADSINGVAKTFVVAGTLYAGTEMYAYHYF